MDDLIIQVDENDKVIGLRPRKEFLGGKIIHRGCHLILFNSKNEFAIMKRSSNKRWYPNVYTFSVSGTVDNESYDDCIKREMVEEIGIDVLIKRLFTFRHFDNSDNAFATVYSATSDKELTPDPYEISEVNWVTLDWLKGDMEKNPGKYCHTFLEGMKVYWEKYSTKLP
jgi:isopentenyldiphosphate isomerase